MSDRGFFGRWSERKRAAEAGRGPPEPEPERVPGQAQPTAPAAAGPPRTEAAAPRAEAAEMLSEEALAELPPIESARSAAELRGYLQRGVPEALRRAALRRIWSLNPAIRDYVDPARDYAWDFTSGGGRTAEAATAAMVARLFGRPPSAPAPGAAAVTGGEGPRAAAERPPLPRGAALEGGAEAGDQPPDRSAQLSASPRRRHGSATPRLPDEEA